MSNDEARAWLEERWPAAMPALERFVECLLAEADRQNLIAASTRETVWSRHIVDSAQLLRHSNRDGAWIDVGSGAGLPGLVLAILCEAPVTLIEPRKLRADFLRSTAAELRLRNVAIHQASAKQVATDEPASSISARAVANLTAVFEMTCHLANTSTIWVLPKGSSAHTEVAEAQRAWHGMFHVERSVVDPNSGIVVASGISRR
jgi:16S rRNA (guanine527-N7)-methyltransferase